MPTDLHRPNYHYLPAKNWMNDPNGLIHWGGKYHLFYQYNPDGAYHANMHWGHAVSTDLVNWTELAIALHPDPNSPDSGGCWSGCAIDNNGLPTFLYTGFVNGTQCSCLAFGDSDLINWTKYPSNPVISGPPVELNANAFRDHSVWREDDQWYQVIGSGVDGKNGAGGMALIYRSPDLIHWEYVHPLTDDSVHQQFDLPTGDIWECPSFFALGDQHVLLVSVWSEHKLSYVAAYIGEYRDHRFVPHTLKKLDCGDQCYYAPQTMLDAQGRRLIWGWLQEERPRAAQIAAGWSGVMSSPRMLSLDAAGQLNMAPVPELRHLRGTHTHFDDLHISAGQMHSLSGVTGQQLEIAISFECQPNGRSGIYVARSQNGEEETAIYIDWDQRTLVVDRTRSSVNADVSHAQRAADLPVDIAQRCEVHVLLDHSVLEVSVNDQAWITTRIYPEHADSVGLGLYSREAGSVARRVDIWKMCG